MTDALAHTGLGRAHLDVVARARRFAREHLEPLSLSLDARLVRDHGYFPWDLVRAGAREGWLSAAIPPMWGGGGVDIRGMSLAMEELCAVDAGVANIFGAHGLGMLPLLLAQDLGLAGRILGHVSRAERAGAPLLCAFAITEPGGGSDVEEAEGLATGDVRTHAERVSGGYRLFGRKVFISNGNVAEYVATFAALDRRAPAESWTAFVVRRGTPGFSCARTERKLGQLACPAAELVFDGAFVPDDLRIGAEGQGWPLSHRVLAVSRGPVGAIACGIARGAFEAAVAWLGASPSRDPWQDEALARMVVAIRAARASYLEAAAHCDTALMPSPGVQRAVGLLARSGVIRRGLEAYAQGKERTSAREAAFARQALLGATAKVAGSDAAMAVATSALDLVPPWAGDARKRTEKCFRDAKLTQIYEGTNQINLRAIAAESWARSARA